VVKNFFLISNLNLPSFSLQPFPLVLSLHPLVKSPSISKGGVKIYFNLYIEISSVPYHSAWMVWMEMAPAFVLRGFKAHAVSSAQTLANTDLSVIKVSTAILPQPNSVVYFLWTLVTLS